MFKEKIFKFKNLFSPLPVLLFLLLSPFLINADVGCAGKNCGIAAASDNFQQVNAGKDIINRSKEKFDLFNPLGDKTDLPALFTRISSFLLWLGTAMLTLMIIWGAFQILTAAGNEEQISKGRRTITWAVIGYILLLVATGINLIIKDILSVK